MPLSPLPVDEALGELKAALGGAGSVRRVVLVAPPGSGKTTRVAPWLLDSGLIGRGQEIVLLQPRRVAARAVASHMAGFYGEPVGQTVGYQVRFDDRTSERTKIRVVTEGILTARLQRDPELKGVGAVILDEFHERSVHADLALALVKEVQEALSPDLLLIVMSATLAAEPVARFLGCPVVRASGRTYPVEMRFREGGAGLVDGRDAEDAMVEAIVGLVDEGLDGDVLGFLHGVRPIEAVRSRLASRLRGVEVLPLHGSLTPREQDLALVSGERPRVVLATNVAETSLTIPGVTTVVDSGLAKVMRYDLAVASNRLETTRISRASADQRSGRAGRVKAGRAVRLWSRHEDDRLRPFEDPEIKRIDLMRLTLELMSWGVEPTTFGFFEAPDARALVDARARLVTMGALDSRGLTPLGRSVVQMPVEPRLAALVALVRDGDAVRVGRWAAALDQGLVDGEIERAMGRVTPGENLERAARQLVERRRGAAGGAGTPGAPGQGVGPGLGTEDALVRSHADRVGVRREGDRYALVGGRLARMVGATELPEVVVCFELEAGKRGEAAVSTLRSWAGTSRAALVRHVGFRVEDELVWEADKRRVSAYRTEYFLDLPLSRKSIPNVDRERSGALLADNAKGALDQVFGGIETADENLVARLVTFFRVFPDAVAELSEEVRDGLGEVVTHDGLLVAALPAMCQGLASFDELVRRPAMKLADALWSMLPYKLGQRVKELLPERLEVPSGSMIKVDYRADGNPVLAVKVQELFGQSDTPRVAGGRLPVVLHLLSPALRPLQVTTDLASFWSRTWPEVRSEMRTRYPKHVWPENPAEAQPLQRSIARPRRS